MTVAGGGGRGGGENGELIPVVRASVWEDERVQEMGGGEDGTTVYFCH